jgi:hypothetical protein
MDVLKETAVSPPGDEADYELQIVDYGQGNTKLLIAPTGERPRHTFTITNTQLSECQWRDEETPVPTEILRAVEYYGYHVTDVTQRPALGLYENVNYLRQAMDEIETELHEENTIGRGGALKASESLDILSKVELLRTSLTEREFAVAVFKAQETSQKLPTGGLEVPSTSGINSVTLKSMVTLILAYAQDDGYLSRPLISPETVERLVERPSDA